MASVRITIDELKRHASENDGWIALNGEIWDISGFAALHPGGDQAIKECLGREASSVYNNIHGPGLISGHLSDGKTKKIGLLDAPSPPKAVNGKTTAKSSKLPQLATIVNLHDFENAAHKTLSEATWAQIAGSTNDGLSKVANSDYYRRIMIRPRILEDVSRCDLSTTLLGTKFELPVFNAPFSSAKIAHPDGELALARGLSAMGSTMIIPTLGSYTVEEILAGLHPGHPFLFQLYVYTDRSITEKLLRHVMKFKPLAIVLTVDLPVMSKREAKERYKAKVAALKGTWNKKGVIRSGARGSDQIMASDMTWKDVKWVKELTGLPVMLKGIQCAADAKRALEHGCGGIYLSNHGGRALDTAPPGILTLLEIQADCPEVLEKMEVFIDGGIRRGTDILKAICLGASAVCLGRPLFYAATYGEAGVKHALEIMKDELQVAMQLSGITSLSQAHPGLLNTSNLESCMARGSDHPWAKKIVRSRL